MPSHPCPWMSTERDIGLGESERDEMRIYLLFLLVPSRISPFNFISWCIVITYQLDGEELVEGLVLF